jgi:hypothetical protein
MTFAYRRYTADSIPGIGSILYRPAVPLRVSGGAGSAWLTALVDTGSDITLLPRSVGELIGADIDESTRWRVGGIGGQRTDVVAGAVRLELGPDSQSYAWEATVGFISVDDPQNE